MARTFRPLNRINFASDSLPTLFVFLNNLSLLLIYGGIVQGVFMTLLLNNRSVRKSRANVFLSVLLLAMTFSVFHSQYAGQFITHFSIRAYSLGDPTFFLIAPLLWFYGQELTGHRIRLSARLLLHFIPCLMLIAFSLLLRNYGPSAPLGHQLDGYPQSLSVLFWGGVVIQFAGYLFAISHRWRAYQQRLQQEVSNTENVSLDWVRFFMGIFLGITVFFLLVLIGQLHHQSISGLSRIIAVLFSLSIFALGYKGILQRDVFSMADVLPEPSGQTASVPANPVRKSDPALVDQLLRYMADEKPYLDPELTLSELAKRVHLSRSVLSQLINEEIGDNFYNFVNRYRIEQVKQFMNDPAMKHYNLLGLALEAGFKSKSTFNLIFKRFTGLTPSDYMQTLRE